MFATKSLKIEFCFCYSQLSDCIYAYKGLARCNLLNSTRNHIVCESCVFVYQTAAWFTYPNFGRCLFLFRKTCVFECIFRSVVWCVIWILDFFKWQKLTLWVRYINLYLTVVFLVIEFYFYGFCLLRGNICILFCEINQHGNYGCK